MKKAMIIAAVVIIALIVIWWALVPKGLYKKIIPVIPVVVSSGTEDSSTIVDYRVIVWAEVRNDGGDGDVVVTFSYRDSTTYTKTSSRFFKANETARMQMEFPEAKLLKDGFYNVEVR